MIDVSARWSEKQKGSNSQYQERVRVFSYNSTFKGLSQNIKNDLVTCKPYNLEFPLSKWCYSHILDLLNTKVEGASEMDQQRKCFPLMTDDLCSNPSSTNVKVEKTLTPKCGLLTSPCTPKHVQPHHIKVNTILI